METLSVFIAVLGAFQRDDFICSADLGNKEDLIEMAEKRMTSSSENTCTKCKAGIRLIYMTVEEW